MSGLELLAVAAESPAHAFRYFEQAGWSDAYFASPKEKLAFMSVADAARAGQGLPDDEAREWIETRLHPAAGEWERERLTGPDGAEELNGVLKVVLAAMDDAAAATAPASYRPFPVSVLPQPAARFIAEGAKAIGCDAAFIALPLLAELAAAIGNSRRIRLKRSWSEPPVLWCAIVADSGTLKSPAHELAHRPMRQRQQRAMKQHKKDLAEYRAAKESYDEAVKLWRKGKPNERGELPDEPESPVCERLIVSDTTVEALADRLSNAPRGLLLARDELSGWLSSFNQYKAGQGGDVAHWLEMHGARPLLLDRKTGDKTTTYVPRAAVCIAGTIQPDTLRRCLTPEFFANGLAARLLLAMPDRKPKRWTDADIDLNTLEALAKLVNDLIEFKGATDSDGEPEPADVGLTPEARALWIDFYNTHADEQAELTGELSAAWSKLEGYAARLALVVHCMRQAAGEDVDPWLCDETSMAAGIALADWFGHEAKRVYAVLAESSDQRADRELIQWIDRHGGAVSVRDVTHGNRTYRGDADKAEAALNRLADAGIGRWQVDRQNQKGGKQARKFHLLAVTTTPESNPVTTVTVTDTPLPDSADEGNGDGDTGDAPQNEGYGDAPGDEDRPPIDEQWAAALVAEQEGAA